MHHPLPPARLRALAFALCAACFTPAHAADEAVTLKRDRWGVPHVYADSTFGLFYGYGYAVAQDRLFQMEMARRSTQGRVAEVLGDRFVDYDRKTRANYDPAAIAAQLAALPADDRAILDGYAAGFNAWLQQVAARPDTLLPRPFTEFGFTPQPWTAFDVAMVFIGTMGNRFGDFNTEIENQALLNALVAKHGEAAGRALFDLLLPPDTAGAPTTIPAADWNARAPARAAAALVPVSAKVLADIRRVPLGRDGAVRDLPPAAAQAWLDSEFAAWGLSGSAGYPSTSNMLVLGPQHVAGARAILNNGPQFGWFNPAYTYSVGLHGAGFDLVGNTAFAYPAVMFGHNGHIAWGSTWGAVDNVDLYRETLNPADPREYRLNGNWVPMEARRETLRVKGGEAVSFEVLKTVHGLVTATDEGAGVAYAKRRAWAGHELDTLLGWLRQGQARNWDEWKAQVARIGFNINVYYADADGNIGYALGGHYPERRHDGRLPAPGDGSAEWLRLRPFAENPQVFNPSSGYIANWNNKPGDAPLGTGLYYYAWARADRVEVLTDLVAATPRLDAEASWRLMMDAALVDVNAKYLVPEALAATAALPADDRLRRAAGLLAGWDRVSRDADRDGRYDGAAPALMQTWLPLLLARVFADDVPAEFLKWYASAGYPSPESPMRGSLNLQIGTKVLVEALLAKRAGTTPPYDLFNGADPAALLRETLAAALDQLERTQGPEPAKWSLPTVPQVFFANNFMGVPQAAAGEERRTRIAQNRGTENNRVVFGSDGRVQAVEVVAPGQSGFIAPDGSRSPHYEDQLGLYEDEGHKPVWFDAADVDANLESQTVLRVAR